MGLLNVRGEAEHEILLKFENTVKLHHQIYRVTGYLRRLEYESGLPLPITVHHLLFSA